MQISKFAKNVIVPTSSTKIVNFQKWKVVRRSWRLTLMSRNLVKKRTYWSHANIGDLKVFDGIKNKEYLLSLTLRQLRQEASKLSVPLYSRKTKAVLIDLIVKYQRNSTNIPTKSVVNNTSKKLSDLLLNSQKK